MANNYEQFTVSPLIPTHLVTKLELKILAGFGVNYEKHGSNYYFFSEDTQSGDIIELSPDDLTDKDNFVVKQLLDYINANADLVIEFEAGHDIAIDLEDINRDAVSWQEITVASVFQSILKKVGAHEFINEITIKGAFTCDRLRQDEFGGFVSLITNGSIKSMNTEDMLQSMRFPENKRIAVIMEGGLVQAIVSDSPESLSVVTIDYDTEGCDEDDLTPVKQSDGSYSNAVCTNECINEPVIDLDEVFGTANGSWIVRRKNADDKKSQEVRDLELAMMERFEKQENQNV